MSNRWFGGLINKTRPTTSGGKTGSASGSFTSTQALQQVSGNNWPQPKTVPGAPTIGTATALVGFEASVTFSAPADDGGSAITGYTVTSSPGGITASGASSPLTVTGLTDGVSYTFTVTATNAVGTSAPSASSNSIVAYTTVYMTATGGTITTSGSYKIHTFTGNGTFTVTNAGTGYANAGKINYLVVAGGGAGCGHYSGSYEGGGGGAGGMLEVSDYSVSASAYSITVGAGGAQAYQVGGSGGNSSFNGVTTTTGGGGGGGGRTNGNSGGSGGGSGYNGGSGGAGTSGQGNSGGSWGTSPNRGGGGGGAGGSGSGSSSAAGGVGRQSSITGSSTYYAGGGGGGNGTSPSGGTGGGGAGVSFGGYGTGTAGTANTGGGGGGGVQPSQSYGAAGGSGVVIISYQYQA